MTDKVDIDFLLEEVVTLPSLPDIVARVTEMAEDPDCQLEQVGKLIATDPSLAMKTLRLVNSAFYGLGQKVSSVEHAVALLGLKVIKNLVFTATVFESLNWGAGGFLRHSMGVAVAMRTIAEFPGGAELPLENAEEAFAIGLLHDVGRLIFGEFLAEEYAAVSDRVAAQGCSFYEAELEIMGVDHGEMGARIAEHWRLSTELAQAIRGHHDYTRCPTEDLRALAAGLSIADYIVVRSGLPSYQKARPHTPDGAWDAMRLGSRDMPRVLDLYFRNVAGIDELMHVAS